MYIIFDFDLPAAREMHFLFSYFTTLGINLKQFFMDYVKVDILYFFAWCCLIIEQNDTVIFFNVSYMEKLIFLINSQWNRDLQCYNLPQRWKYMLIKNFLLTYITIIHINNNSQMYKYIVLKILKHIFWLLYISRNVSVAWVHNIFSFY